MSKFKTSVKGLSKMIRPLRGSLAVSVLIGLVRIAASLGFVWVCKALVDIATGVSAASLGGHIAIMIGIMLVQILASAAASYWESYISVNTLNKLRFDTFSHVLNSTWNGMETFNSGDTVNRIQEDTRVITELICSRIPDVIVTLCQLLAASLFLLAMAPKLLWLLIIFMVVAVLGSRMFFKMLQELTRKIRSKDGEIQQHMQENLLNRVLVLTLVGSERVMDKLGWMQKDVKDNTVKRLNFNAVARSFMHFGFMAGYAAAFLWGVLGIKDGTVTYGMMTAFLQLVGQVQRPIADLSRHVPAFIHSLISIERIMDLQELELEEEAAPIMLPGAPGIEIRDISFSYPGQREKVLDHFSHTFAPGSLTAIMGPTGSGKSTLVRLVMGLLRPSEGDVLVGGERAGVAVRGNFMYVPQGNSLLSGTIRENLMLANPEATEQDMLKVLSQAKADFVSDLPEGLDTRCGEVGSGLSEGQSQRIAIARALLHPGGILILDEATSALDSETESELLQNLYSAYHSTKTILFISHREAVTGYSDAILKL
ncbi:MAG: ABC transporter ATP-binding protein [Bacteroidales bacterium]|nr:ABC transporter ATP-binding protein [Bacteroidales bacterium]